MALHGERIQWRVWAPDAKNVELVLLEDGQPLSFEHPQIRPMRNAERDIFQCEIDAVPEAQRYAFRLDGGPPLPDPCSLWQPDGVHGPSAVVRPERFGWTDGNWRGIRRSDLVFYELHVGTFTKDGTFDAVIPRLGQLRDLGVTAIEILPVGQFPGKRNWGYDGVSLYAAQNSYGGPQGLQRLIDACHQHGLAAILDVVYNHFGPEGNYLGQFGPYFTDRYATGWGSAMNFDDAGSDGVRRFVLDNARMWLEEFHFDGLRLDAVHAIFDFGAKHLLADIQEVADDVSAQTGRTIHIVAESDLNDPRLLLPPERGGYGLAAQWSDDFHHAVHAYLTGEHQGYYEDFGTVLQLSQSLTNPFLYEGQFSPHRKRRHGAPATGLSGDRFVIAIQNHDQVGNRARGDRLGTLLSEPAQRLAASLMLLAPRLPLLFMGEEYGETKPFPFFCSFTDEELIHAVRAGRRREFSAFTWQGEVPDPAAPETFESARLQWSWPQGTHHAGLRQLYADLLAARRQWPAMQNFSDATSHLLPDPEHGPLIRLVRGGAERSVGQTIEAFFNLSKDACSLPYPPGPPHVRLFSSESEHYHGSRRSPAAIDQLLPYECVVFGPEGWTSLLP